jgi:multidrug efflux pump subunit AcrA (membrane-fusion protein)
VVTPRREDLLGTPATPGDSLVELWNPHELRVRIRVPERDAAGVTRGAPVGMRFPSDPGLTYRTTVQQVSAAAHDGYVDALALLTLPAASRELLPGMTGTAKIVVGRKSLGGALGRSVRRAVRPDWLL